MKGFGVLVLVGLLATIVTGGLAAVALQPIIAANIAFGANTWLAAWLVAGLAGYVVATAVWAIVVGVLMATVFGGMQ